MNYRKNLKTRFTTLFLLLTFVFFGASARASVLTVSPALVRMSISAQQPTAEAYVTLRNDSALPSSYEVRLVDVDVGTGQLSSLATVSARTEKIFSIPTQLIQLAPGASQPFVVLAQNSEDVAPGGHYAAVEIRRKEQGTAAKPPIVQMVSVGLFLTKEDGAKREVSLLTQKGGRFRFGIPKSYEVALRNDGNVDVTPRGFVALTSGTKEYSKVQLNDTSRPIFAGQSSTYAVPLSGGRLWPGKYRLLVSYRADSGQQQQVFVDEFWYIPVFWLLFTCIAVMLLVYVWYVRKKRTKKLRDEKGAQQTSSNDVPPAAVPVHPPKQKQRTIIVTEMAREAVRTHTPRTRKKKITKKQSAKKKRA